MYIGGLDIGTTGCKVSVYDDKGNFVCNSYREYKVSRKDGEHEFDAEMIYDAVLEVIGEASKQCEISAVGVTSFGESFVALDECDRALFPSMLYTDPRGEVECAALTAALGEKKLIDISGVKPNQMYSLPKLMWLKANYPEKYALVRRVLLMEDYIVYKLSGVATIDYSLAARTMALDIRTRTWSKEIFDAAGVDSSLFSTPVSAGHVAGELRDDLKASLGINYSMKIVNGSHDQVAATVGCGIFKPGEAMDGTGTVECIVPVFDSIPENETLFDEGYSVVPFIHEGTYVCYALSFTAALCSSGSETTLQATLRARATSTQSLTRAFPTSLRESWSFLTLQARLILTWTTAPRQHLSVSLSSTRHPIFTRLLWRALHTR